MQRHFVDREIGASDLGYEAAKIALQRADLKPSDIDFIIFATLSPDYMFPGSGCPLQALLGVTGIGALDVRTQCTGFVYGLAVANAFIAAGQYKRILLVGAEVHSTGLEFAERGRHIAVLFGDGAGAVIIEASENGRGILSTHLHADGRHVKDLWTENPGSRRLPRMYPGMLDDGSCYPQMNGREVFKHAVTKFPEVIMEALKANNLSLEDVKLVIPHQANLRISEAVTQRLGLPPEKVFNNIQRYGNTTAASIPIALDEALEMGKIQEGDLVVLASFGSGFTWASAAIRW
jgi:3-oxoacyl-[acyl-carrier-protein] synthase-3